MQSVEEAGLGRRPPLRQHRQLGRGLFTLQMRQNPLDDSRIFNASDDLDLPLTALAGLNVDPDAAQLNTRFSRCIQVIATWRSAGVLSSQFSPAG